MTYSLTQIKELLDSHGVVHGLVSDEFLINYLSQKPLPKTPFQVACGTPAEAGKPPEIRYTFEIDHFRVGTLQADGTMDWKNRGKIPQIKAGDLLAEKAGGKPGKPGINVYGEQIPPPRVKEPQLKCGKGAERSEEGTHVLAKLDGTPKLGPDGRITVLSVLPIAGDIGLETGHIQFDGYIEAEGAVCSGYTVKGGALRAQEVQDASIELSGDLISFGGVYGSKIKIGGGLKASHIHNCQIDCVGDLIVEKEIFSCTINVNGRCIVDSGKIIGSRISAKKGIQVRDIGTEASKPSQLTVGIDHHYEQQILALKEALGECEQQKKDVTASLLQIEERANTIGKELGRIKQEQEGYRIQKHQFESQLEGPKAVQDEEERTMLNDLVAELIEQCARIDSKMAELTAQDNHVRKQMSAFGQSLTEIDKQFSQVTENMAALENSLITDPGIPVVKVNGTAYAKTSIAALHCKLILSTKMKNVRIAEVRSEIGAKQWQIKISNLK
jgi:uncharacterized protein